MLVFISLSEFMQCTQALFNWLCTDLMKQETIHLMLWSVLPVTLINNVIITKAIKICSSTFSRSKINYKLSYNSIYHVFNSILYFYCIINLLNREICKQKLSTKHNLHTDNWPTDTQPWKTMLVNQPKPA